MLFCHSETSIQIEFRITIDVLPVVTRGQWEYAYNRYYASDNEVQGYLEALSTISSDYGPALSVQMNGYIVHSV